MSIYPNLTRKVMINLAKLAEQQKNQRAEKKRKRILMDTHDVSYQILSQKSKH